MKVDLIYMLITRGCGDTTSSVETMSGGDLPPNKAAVIQSITPGDLLLGLHLASSFILYIYILL